MFFGVGFFSLGVWGSPLSYMDRISIVYASCSEGNGALVGMEKLFWVIDMVK